MFIHPYENTRSTDLIPQRNVYPVQHTSPRSLVSCL